jgi:hypothetical protein
MTNFETPILLIIFNSPTTTQYTFDAIRSIKPRNLYVAADGPRQNHPDDNEKCILARDIIKQIDWDCQIKTNFREANSGGAGKGVSSAISWFFQNVEEGIILEYDCVAHPDFFIYCSELLNKYRNDDTVMFIGGDNFQDGLIRGKSSYYFSPLAHIWGWATWKRVWNKYVYDANMIDKKEFSSALKFYNKDSKVIRYWQWVFFLLRNAKIDTWDYQLLFAIWLNHGVSIIPNVNLVTHLVLNNGDKGTYFTSHVDGITNIPTHSILPLLFLENQEIDISAYEYHYKKFKMEMSRIQLLYSYFRTMIPDSVIIALKRLFFSSRHISNGKLLH